MTTKSHFISNYFGPAEQSLVNDLVRESIQQFGVDMLYIPRNYVREDMLYGEDILSNFDTTYTVEFYIDSVQGFDGNRDQLAKFGLMINDDMNLTIHKNRFEAEVTANEPDIIRPREGDLVYFPFDKKLYEITFVENQEPFYQTGTLYTYSLRMTLFEFAGESFDTGEPEIDVLDDRYAETTILRLEGAVGGGGGDFGPIGTIYYNQDGTKSGEVLSFVENAPSDSLLTLINVVGEFTTNDSMKSSTNVLWGINEITHDDKESTANNNDIQDEASAFVDFSVKNAFSE